MTTSASQVTLDVREILKAGGEPFDEIMQAVAALAPGQALHLLATFKPMPLFGVMAQRGYTHAEREIGDGDWEVIFSPAAASGTAASPETSRQAFLDVRGLLPPEPMQRALEAVETLKAGESLQVLTDREPTLLYQELKRRSHAYTSESSGEGYRTTIRRGEAVGESA
ncbi:MAG: DUF2249 domain-containing protein [Burkholderiales bacterium]|nr:DUF2249 domain-containing protein [Burkholderiales bacterium]